MRVASTEERERILAGIRECLAGHPEVLFAYLHGSFVEGGPYRDVDLAVFLDPLPAEAAERRRWETALAAELQLRLAQPVDVRLLNDAPPAFRYHATGGLPLIVRDPERLADFRARTWDDYFDFQPFARRYLREALGAELNLDRLRDLAGQLRNALRELREIAALGQESFLRDSRLVNSAKYLLIVAAEAALDICNHLAARKGGRSPQDYADCIAILGELGVVTDALKSRLVKMARFRNLLVHLYWKVEDAEVFRVIQEDLADFDAYLASLGRYLRAEL